MDNFSERSTTLRTDLEKRATVNGHNAACYHKRFVEEGLSYGGYLLGVKFAAEES